MNKLWKLTGANLKKIKSVTVTLTVMFMIAAFLLSAGLLVAINYGGFFGSLTEELQPSDVYYMIPDGLYTDEVNTYFGQNTHLGEIRRHDALWLDANIISAGADTRFSVMFMNMDEPRDANKWKLLGEHLPPDDMTVYLPDIFNAVSGYELGDTIEIRYMDADTGEERTLRFTVGGYTEDVFFSSTDTGYLSFYLPEETYGKIGDILSAQVYRVHIVFADVDETANIARTESDLRDIMKLNSSSLIAADASSIFLVIDIGLVELSRCMMANIVSIMLALFAVIIVVVCLLVVHFRIVGSVEDDAMNIGSLKAIGYTSRQIILSVIMQFSLIACIGSIVGIALSYPAMPAVSRIFERQSGLKWVQGFDGAISAVTFLSLLFIVVLVSAIAARHIGGLHPISALRGETTARRYRKNHVPLDRSRGGLAVTLAFKSVLQGAKQSIMIFIIIIAVTFAGAYGIIMFYNTSIDTKAFAEVPGFEICNTVAVLNPALDQTEAVDTILAMDGVRKAQYLDEVKIKIDGAEASAFVMDDYSRRESILVYEGRYPERENEIAIAGILAGRLGRSVGDEVTVQFGRNEEIFRVVGLSNGSSMGGLNSSILASDFSRLNPDFRHQSLYIYLESGFGSAPFVKALEETLDKDMLLSAIDFDKELASGMAAYQNIVAVMGLSMLVITLLVIALVLYFVISSSVIRKKRELGIQKAVGFTTFQLMNQLALGFAASLVPGAIIGSMLGAFYTNPLMSVAMKGMGIMKAGFIVDGYWVLAFCAATIIVSYALSMLVTWRIRKISAYALITE